MQSNYVSPGYQIPQVEARKRCSRDLFTSSGRATALIGRHFLYTFLQHSTTRLTNTAILLIVRHVSIGDSQEIDRYIFTNATPGALGRRAISRWGSGRLNVTLCRTCTVPLWDAQRTVGSWSYWENILGWMALRSPSSPHLCPNVVYGTTFWGEEGRMTVWPLKTSANGRGSAHSISLMAALLRSTRTQRCLTTTTLRCQRLPGPQQREHQLEKGLSNHLWIRPLFDLDLSTDGHIDWCWPKWPLMGMATWGQRLVPMWK